MGLSVTIIPTIVPPATAPPTVSPSTGQSPSLPESPISPSPISPTEIPNSPPATEAQQQTSPTTTIQAQNLPTQAQTEPINTIGQTSPPAQPNNSGPNTDNPSSSSQPNAPLPPPEPAVEPPPNLHPMTTRAKKGISKPNSKYAYSTNLTKSNLSYLQPLPKPSQTQIGDKLSSMSSTPLLGTAPSLLFRHHLIKIRSVVVGFLP